MVYETLFIVTITAISLIIYHHVGYPLLLKWLANRVDHQSDDASLTTSTNQSHQTLPTITVLMPAYNEALWIGDKIRNLAMLDYPSDKLTVVLACDGCSDNTAQIAQSVAQEPHCQHLNLVVHQYAQNRGKVATLNDAMTSIDSDIVAFSDVSALISFDAMQLAAAKFNDPNIGVVNSHYCFLAPSQSEQQYWQYQSNIQRKEAQIGSVLGAHGALYFIRRELFSPLESDTINDDFVLPMRIVEQGYRADLLDGINAVELEQSEPDQDFRRRLRIGAGNCQQLLRLSGCLHPKYKGVAFAFASGKALRVLMPFLMLVALVGSIVLSFINPLFSVIAIGQIALYSIASYQSLSATPSSNKLIKAVTYLVVGHTANLIGATRYLCGFEKGHWKRVSEKAE